MHMIVLSEDVVDEFCLLSIHNNGLSIPLQEYLLLSSSDSTVEYKMVESPNNCPSIALHSLIHYPNSNASTSSASSSS